MDSALALLMIAAVLIALAVLVGAAMRRKLDQFGSRLGYAVVSTALLVALMLLCYNTVMRDAYLANQPDWYHDITRAAPVRQLAVGAFCCFVFTLIAPLKHGYRARFSAFVATGTATFLLFMLYTSLNYPVSKRFITMPSYAERISTTHIAFVCARAVGDLDAGMNDPKSPRGFHDYPAGWLRASDFMHAVATDYANFISRTEVDFADRGPVRVHALWHTPLTGLHAVQPQAWGFWYVGGRPGALQQQIEVRVKE